jgi:hypothetical protein
VEPLPDAEHRKQAIVHGGQVTHEVEQSILPWGNLLLELLVRECREVLV